MAKFKLSLINLNTAGEEKSLPTYFKQTISEFYDQRSEYLSKTNSPLYSYCYTYNEKFSESTNSQKKLSFSMDRKIIRDDRIEDNPFVYNLAIGSQLLLEDKYGEHHLMTITDIQFNFKELNLTYNYQCQDSFTWQLSRQNNGYEITNDPSATDFIGAMSIDDWTEKITTDCNVTYVNSPLVINNEELNTIKDFTKTIMFSGSGTANSLLISLAEQYGLQIRTYEHFNDDNTITKNFYYVPIKSLKTSGLKYSPYQDIQNFGLSHTGSSLSSILNVTSHEINDNIVSLIPSVPAFFRNWFQTDEWKGSVYTPGLFSSKCQAQSFEFHGQNIEGEADTIYYAYYSSDRRRSFKDEENESITFNFNSNNASFNTITIDWVESGKDGSLIAGQISYKDSEGPYTYSHPESLSNPYNLITFTDINSETKSKLQNLYYTWDEPECPPYIPNSSNKFYFINNNIYIQLDISAIPSDYNLFRFQCKEKKSKLYTQESIEENISNHYHFNTDTVWKLCRLKENSFSYIRPNLDTIPAEWYESSDGDRFYVCIPGFSNVEFLKVIDYDIYLDFYRNPSEEELEFASVADECPWLENKLVDFTYFYNHAVINRKQYGDLIQVFQNDLRKTNSKLLLYSQLYYQALQNKTKELANLESRIDRVGATFNADFLQPVTDNKPYESTDFILAYSDLTSQLAGTEKINLIDYEKTMSDYITKYINAEQTFLKNMYLFRKYFNEKVNKTTLNEYVISLIQPESPIEGDRIISFAQPETYVRVGQNNITVNNLGLPIEALYREVVNEDDTKTYTAISNDDIMSQDKIGDKNLYYLTELNSMYRIHTDETRGSEYPLVERHHQYNKDTEYFEEQWIYPISDGELDTYKKFSKPVRDNRYELFKVDIWNKKAYIRSYNHYIQNRPSENLTFKINNDTSTVINYSSLESIYEPVGLYELKLNYFQKYFYSTNKEDDLYKKSPLTYLDLYYRAEVQLQPFANFRGNGTEPEPTEVWKKQGNEYVGKAWKDILMAFPTAKNDDSLEDENDTTKLIQAYNRLFKANFPLQSLYFKTPVDEDGNPLEEPKEGATPKDYEVTFINYNNAASAYRRCRKGNGKEIKTKFATWWRKMWNNGNTEWGTEGWTYQDVWGNEIDSFNSSWYDKKAIVYTKTASAWDIYEELNDVEIKWDGEKYTDLAYWHLKHAQNILLTYHSFQEKIIDDYYIYRYRPYYWRFLKNDDFYNPEETYYIITEKTDEYVNTDYAATDNRGKVDLRVNALKNYPLQYVFNSLPPSNEVQNSSTRLTIKQFLQKQGMYYVNGWSDTGTTEDGYVFIIHEEHYEPITATSFIKGEEELTTDLTTDEITKLAMQTWYDKDHFRYDLTQIDRLADGFFIHKQNESYALVTDDHLINDSNFYYRTQNDGSYQRIETINQLMSNGNICKRDGDTKTYTTFGSETKVSYSVNIYEYKKGKYEFIDTVSMEFDLVENELDESNNPKPWIVSDYNTGYIIKWNDRGSDFRETTNGEFYFKYINDTRTPLMHEAMLIETNLTEFWTNAYYASKNCRYFIPEFWQATVSGKENNWSKQVVNVENNDGKITVNLLSTYIPFVNIKSYQPKYEYIYDSNTNIITSPYDTNNYYTEYQITDAYTNQPWLQDIVENYLGLDNSHLKVRILNNNATYYSRVGNSGKTWFDILQDLGGRNFPSLTKFGGWYDMAIKVLKDNYVSYTVKEYNDALAEHNRIWRQIYTYYPHLIYEQSYTSENALTSTQLLNEAKFALRQYTDIERQYNIQTIDFASLKGYTGQHLRIGDAIQLDADELYDQYDDIKTSLLQYLFVSDINYDLRSDANISLTVNNIKYSDKVIGELVKLIR